MLYKTILLSLLWVLTVKLQAQDTTSKKQRLDFAKTYFDYGGTYIPSFTGASLSNGQVNFFRQSASLNQYLTWGAFHFWGHAEFYVTIPLNQYLITKNEETNFQLIHSVATGGRFYPWAVKEKKIRPYVGVNWGALDFKQIRANEELSMLTKGLMLNYEAGFTYNYKNLGVRLGVNFFNDNKWQYPISKTQKTEITTPAYSVQLGILYAFDSSKNGKKKDTEEWNRYPRISRLSYKAKKFGDFFLGAGPSSSYSLRKSDYNRLHLPFLDDRLISKNYFDLAIGYQFNKANLFTALSFRNPAYETAGFGVTQKIKKTSLAIEVNKYLTDYTGFAPYIGINLAYDKIVYSEDADGIKRELSFSNRLEPGITAGWDIVPGKTSEALVLRTNLRWYPYSDFEVDGKKFNFSQLEYNLIQLVFYPDRLRKQPK